MHPVSHLPVEHLFVLELEVTGADAHRIGDGEHLRRIIAPVTGGSFRGPRLRGEVASTTGADWVTMQPDGSARIDVRLVLLTDDGATIYMHYLGVMAGRSVRSAPYFDTADDRYTWLNAIQGIGIGTVRRTAVSYDVFAVVAEATTDDGLRAV